MRRAPSFQSWMLPSRSWPMIEYSVEASSTLPMKLAATWGSAKRSGARSLWMPPAEELARAVPSWSSTTGAFRPADVALPFVCPFRFGANALTRPRREAGAVAVRHVPFSDGGRPTHNLRTMWRVQSRFRVPRTLNSKGRPCGLPSLLALESPILVPRLDQKVVGGQADPNQNHLGDIHFEVKPGLVLVLTSLRSHHLDRAAADLGVAEPGARVVL